ncbi:MAG TPA: DNA primase, partial [Anaerolineales bacterium]|nr:DNA primase [Anaerolineales bacterium]
MINPVDEIKARLDIIELVSESVQLRRSGKSYTGFCPFHSNTRTPAFVVWPETGTWRCFGQCNEGGDVFNYVMKKEGWDFSEALRYLAERAGVELTPQTPDMQAAQEEHDALRQMLEDAVTFFRHHLQQTEPGRLALQYLLEKRGLTAETIESFGLGYAPAGWDNLTKHFHAKGVSDDELVAAGLVSEKLDDQGRRVSIYDRFRHRVTFPIRDERGRMTGFGARILNPDEFPKFLNSPQTAVFDKSGLLYGLDRARKSIRQTDQAVIVEGYLDVIALHQAGFANAVSPMGTALSPQQLNLIKRYSRRIVLALDSDAAGDKATLRGLEVARETLDREADPVFDARGLLGHETRLKADIRVTTLPEGKDPDDVVLADPQAWERILHEAKPIVIHVMETLARGRDLDDPKVKADVAAQALPLIEDVPNPIERDAYRQRLARLIRVDERALLQSMGPARARPPRRAETRPQPGPRRPGLAPGLAQIEVAPGGASLYSLEAHEL